MKKALLDVLFMSEKRTSTLLLLKNGAKGMEYLLSSLKTNRQSLLPQMRVLEEHYLVDHYKDTYKLTTIGNLIVDEMAPLVDATEVLDADIDYWGTHNLEFVPPDLLERINELRNCKVLNPSIVEMFEINKDFVESAIRSGSIFLISTIMHPDFTSLLSDFIKGNKEVLLIISKEVLSKLREESYNLFKEFIDHGGVKFYLYENDLKVTTVAISDSCFTLRLLSENNEFSNKKLICNDPCSYQWSKDLFDHYLKRSILITEI
ncbi:helix-turn-helix transcriptional regulator [Methanomethylovorans sp.]|uniref:helix-turn-helix transcriptional regulator n=1 Tax=Methanomethylovorans sp. TaxID=2758717 RepID=UPI00351C51EF